MVFMIMPIIIFCVVIFVIGLFFVGPKNKKIVINEVVSKEYQEKSYELIKNNPNIASERFKYKLLGVFIFILFLLMILFIYLSMTTQNRLFILFIILSIVGMVVISIFRKSKTLFNEIIPQIISNYKEGLTYSHDKGIPSNIYREARFESWDRYHSEDLITGKINNCNFSMAEVHTEDRYTDSEGHTHYSTIFRGTFATIDLNKSFGSWVNIINNRIKVFSRDNYISLENTEFEKIYDVFTGDKIKAMRLLTPDVTTRMIDLYNETGLYCEIKITDNKMYIRLYTSGLFELSFSNPEKEAKQIGSCIAVIDNVFKITENFIKELERLDD